MIHPEENAPGPLPQLIDPVLDAHFMNEALRLAKKAARLDEVPVGAVIVRQGDIVGRAWNQVETLKDATAHAEMLALTQAESAAGDWRLTDCDLYVTKEPCPMCAGAIVWARIKKLCFGASDSRTGSCGSILDIVQNNSFNHRIEIKKGVLCGECKNIITNFFKIKRTLTSANQKK